MPSPTSREELETVLGMATYPGKFAQNLSDVTAPLRDLTKKENAFIWDAVSEKAYNSMKQLLCKEPGPVLAYFDPQKDVVLFSMMPHRRAWELHYCKSNTPFRMHQDV